MPARGISRLPPTGHTIENVIARESSHSKEAGREFMNAYAIVPAAGLSTRMGSTTSGAARKQLLEFQGAPILIHTLRKLDRCHRIDAILVPVRPEDRDRVADRVAAESFRCPVHIVTGGETRQASVWNALQQVPAEARLVLVHDAVRPFVTTEIIERALDGAAQHRAVIVAVPAIDTIKQVERAGSDTNRIVATLPRERIVLAQTPQAFDHALLRRAFERAQQEGFSGTDESSLMEHIGQEVFVVPGSPRNWKITTPDDLPLAEMFFQAEAKAVSS